MPTNHAAGEEPRPETTAKKPYEKPSFRYEQVFVTTALGCGKTGTQGSCATGLPRS